MSYIDIVQHKHLRLRIKCDLCFLVINLVIKCVSWILKYNISSISYRRNKCVFVFSFDDALGGFVRVLFLVCWFGSKEDK